MNMSIYEKKQLWIEKVMATKVSHAHKVWAFCIFKRCYGDKVVSFPDSEAIKEDGGFASHAHFKKYRDFWIEAGALEADLDYHTKTAHSKNYEYTLNLDWATGTMSHLEQNHVSSGRTMSHLGQNHVSSSDTNTSTNTSTQYPKEDPKYAAGAKPSLRRDMPKFPALGPG